MKDLYNDILAAITANVPTVRWVDFDLGQLDGTELPPVSYPCVLIGFEGATYSEVSQLIQLGEVSLSIRVAFKTFERTGSAINTTFRDVGLAHLDVLRQVHFALQGLTGAAYSQLSRTSMSQEPRADLRVYRYSYRTIYTDGPDTAYHAWPDDHVLKFCTDAEFLP
jgi:hypothetical protein